MTDEETTSMDSGRPRVSIGLPTRNSIAFLEARIASILAQTLQDWELVVVDGESTDGTWETLMELAANDSRVKLERAKPEGIYPAFNRCVEKATGKYVYIATSDDTMAVDCLEKLARALDENPDCDIAHCPMKVLAPDGNEGLDWWSVRSAFARSSGEWLNRPHRRQAPHDGLICLLGDNVYSSVTQILIRRSLFDKIGLYPTAWGSVGDFHWNLRAGLHASSVHVPDTWASWRMHEGQATAGAGLGSSEHEQKIDGMIEDVLSASRQRGKGISPRLESRTRDLRKFLREFNSLPGPRERKAYVMRSAFKGFRPAWSYLASLVPGRRRWPHGAPEIVRSWIKESILPIA